jgi:cysteine desulfurase
MIHGDIQRTADHMVNLTIPGLLAEEAMESAGDLIAISNGSACTSHSKVCSHVLAAMGVREERAAGALRFSWCHVTEEPDWSAVVDRLCHAATAVA